MRTFDFAPLFRSTVGFDRLFDLAEQTTRADWPPYNIEKRGDNKYRISMALAGFAPNEIDLVQQGNTLTVSGQKKAPTEQQEMLHQGLAYRNFRQTFSLADHVKVASANIENGLLSVELVREIPEELKPRRIEVGSATTSLPTQGSRPELVSQERKTSAA